MSLHHALACVLLVVVALIAAPAQALEIRCVDSEIELDSSLAITSEDAVEIHLVRGEYDVHETRLDNPYFDTDYDLTIVGGYAPGCTSRWLDPRETVLFGASVDQTQFGFGEDVDIRFESLTLRDIRGGFHMNSHLSSTNEARLSRVKLERARIWASSERVVLSQVIVVDGGSDAGCVIDITDPETVNIIHSVFAGNDDDVVCVTGNDGDWEVFADNNVFWNNAGNDLVVHAPHSPNEVYLLNNIIQTTSILPDPVEAPVGSLDADPLFVDPDAADFHLQAGSPAINSGIPLSLGLSQDTDGGPRWTGSRPDRGGYETNVDDTNSLVVTTAVDQVAPLISGSLRWAITQSNADPDTNTIRFDIPGECPRIIHLDAPLPSITDRVIIDGYSQPGSEAATSSLGFNATLCIGIDGEFSSNHALEIPISVGSAQSLNVSGIGFGGFNVGAIRLAGGAGSWIHGNQFGGELDGVAIGNSAVNVRIGGTSYHNLIGGDEPAQRNLIMGAWNAGIELLENSGGADGYENFVINNYIGTSASGNAMGTNNLGIRVRTRGNEIKDNLISGNQSHGVVIEGTLADDNLVSSNRIGLKSFWFCAPAPCDPEDYALANFGFGVLVDGGNDNRIQFNEVAHNGSKGIRLFEGQRNRLLGNSVHDNASFGIDVGVEGINPDYGAGSDQLANHGINAPSIAAARGGQHAGRLTGLVTARGATSYVMQAFSNRTCDASGHGEGQTLVGTKIIAVGGSPGSGGTVEYEMPIESNGDLQPRFIATTWFDEEGNSSEFSNCVAYQCDTIFAHDLDSAEADRCEAP